MKKIEILAPAGSFTHLKAAVNAGCDAVYVGGVRFGARAYAANFNEEELCQAINYMHLYDKQLYLTVNTLLKDSEVKEELYNYLLKPYQMGLDAVIVQDIGVLHFIHKHFPDLPIHASTQMTLVMSTGAKFLEDYGVSRIVTSRELSLKEIKEIHNQTNLEIESFVHGALCYCYSGQCLMSSMLGGRSGNRGRCAGTCRMPYELSKNKSVLSNPQAPYLLSPKDICTVDLIPDMVEAGIDSFKIEGRMKSVEYTAYVSSVYRNYVDMYQDMGIEGYQEYLLKNKKQVARDMQNLMELYNRGSFTSGYYKTYHGKSMMSMQRPNNNGIQVGEIIKTSGNTAEFLLSKEIQSQDLLEFRGKSGDTYEYTVKLPEKSGEKVSAKFMRDLKFLKGDPVYRMKNQRLLESIQEKYIENDQKIPITGTLKALLNQPLELELVNGTHRIMLMGDIVQEAKNQPITEEKIKSQLMKTNTTKYEFKELSIQMDSQIFVPVGWLNELRRGAIQALETALLKEHHRNLEQTSSTLANYQPREGRMGICVTVSNEKQLQTILSFDEVEAVYIRLEGVPIEEIATLISIAQEKEKKVYLLLPHIFRSQTYKQFTNAMKKEGGQPFSMVDGFVIRNFEEYEWIMEQGLEDKDLILDYNLYVMNQEAKEFWHEKGISHFIASVEQNYKELKQLGIYDSDLLVYGYVPLMVSAQCLVDNTVGCTKKESIYELTDRYKKSFKVYNHCKFCYNTIYNEIPLSLLSQSKEVLSLHPDRLRLDFIMESPSEVKDILIAFIEVFRNGKKEKLDLKHYTKGHFKRGVE